MEKKRRQQRLETTVTAIQLRWGNRAIYTAGQPARTPHGLSTGIAALDTALDIGGLPAGQMCEFIGCGSAGHLTAALRVLAQTQHAGAPVAYVDMGRTIDLDYLAYAGIRLKLLIVLRPADSQQAVEMIRELAEDGVGALLVDRTNDFLLHFSSDHALTLALRSLGSILHRTNGQLLFLTQAKGTWDIDPLLPHYLAVRVLFEHQAWRYRRARVVAFTSRVTILKNKFGTPGRSFSLTISVEQRKP
jgi:hypothetical protein